MTKRKKLYPIDGLRLAIKDFGSPMRASNALDLPLQELLDVLARKIPMPEHFLKAFETYAVCGGISPDEFKSIVNAELDDPNKQWRVRVHHSKMRLVKTIDGRHYLMQRDRLPPKGARFPTRFAGKPVYHEGDLRFQFRNMPILPLF